MMQSLKLRSPVGAEPIILDWASLTTVSFTSSSPIISAGNHIIETIKWVCEEFSDLKESIEKNISFENYIPTSYASIKTLCEHYNRTVENFLAAKTISTCDKNFNSNNINISDKRASKGLLRHILQQTYNQAIDEPERLNNYEPFSPEVYGETSYELINQMIENSPITGEDVFIDLGSGVGQVVLQMAAATSCKVCYGIEKATTPAEYAISMDKFFRKWMNWFGKRFGDYKLIKGDFLDSEHKTKMYQASIIFVNNFAFGPQVDHMLKECFADLRDGVRIVSSKAFCPLNFKISHRNLSDIGTIMNITELPLLNGSVSWTDNPVTYYVQIIDRTKLEQYFQQLKGKENHKSTREHNIKKDDSSGNEVDDLTSQTSKIDMSVGDTDSETPRVTTRQAWTNFTKSKTSDEENTDNTMSNSQLSSTTTNSIIVKSKTFRKKITVVNLKTSRGRPRKTTKLKRGKRKKVLKINGLDLLHSETIASIVHDGKKKLPPGPGCVDQQLTSISSTLYRVPVHEEFEIPQSSEEPYGLHLLMELYKEQYMRFLKRMKQPEYHEQIKTELENQKKKNEFLKAKESQLEKQINILMEGSFELFKIRMSELGSKNGHSPADLLNIAKGIVSKQRELKSQALLLQTEIKNLENEQKNIVDQKRTQLPNSAKSQTHEMLCNYILNLHDMAKNAPKNTPKNTEREKYPFSSKSIVSKPPRIDNFQDRVTNIVTSALNEQDNSHTVINNNQQQPDYTRVSPAKLALQRHLSQQKTISSSSLTTTTITRTIGDLVSGEIERTLEISNTTKSSHIITKRALTIHDKHNNDLFSNIGNSYDEGQPRGRQKTVISPHYRKNQDEKHDYPMPLLTSNKSKSPMPPIKEEPVEGLAASLSARILNNSHETCLKRTSNESASANKRYQLDAHIPDLQIPVGVNNLFSKFNTSASSSPISNHINDDSSSYEKWQNKISTRFERIVAFASTELDKRRRSTEYATTASTSNSASTTPTNINTDDPSKTLTPPPVLQPFYFNNCINHDSDSFNSPLDDNGHSRTPSPSAQY